MSIQVKGTFTKRKGFIYRTETFIQFGDSEEIIGSCILCNPGSARLDDKEKQKKLEDYDGDNDYIYSVEALKEDGTIKQLIKILKKTGVCEYGGRFLIHNLFTLRNGNMDKALKEFKDPNIDLDLLYKDYDDYAKLQSKIPWTLIGWGCKDNKVLNEIKKEWLHNFNENKVNTIGYEHAKNPHYYHPLPMIHSKLQEYVDIVSEKLVDLLEKRDNKSNNIININEHRFKRLIDKEASIREFGDRFEYCLISEYENKYDEFICDSIGIGEVFVQLLTVKGEPKLVSIDFPKELFDIEDIPNYLSLYDIKLLKNGQDKIHNACKVITGLKFRGTPIVFYEIGIDNIIIDIDELVEVTEVYENSKYRINTSSSKLRNSITPESKIFLNDEEISYIPEIGIDLTKDLIIANGHIMVASHIGDYMGCLGFFENKYDPLPISWIYDRNTTIFIEINEQTESKIVIVEHNYAINLEEL